MDLQYFQQFSNDNIKRELLRPENIPVLEDILDEKITSYEKLRDSKLDFGEFPAREDLSSLLEGVKPVVDRFLGVEGIGLPTIDYHFDSDTNLSLRDLWDNINTAHVDNKINKDKSVYWNGKAGTSAIFSIVSLSTGAISVFANNPTVHSIVWGSLGVCFLGAVASFYCLNKSASNFNRFAENEESYKENKKLFEEKNKKVSQYFRERKHISLRLRERILLISDITHEYAHHVQEEKRFPYTRFTYLWEGQAISVERQIGMHYSIMEGNPAFLYEALEQDVRGLKSAYYWLTQKLEKTPKVSLLMSGVSKSELDHIEEHGTPGKHAMGNAFFSILEALEGTGIQKDIMAGRYELL